MNELTFHQMETINGGSWVGGFCAGFAGALATTSIGAALGWWAVSLTPGAQIAVGAVSLGCAAYGVSQL